VNIDITIELMAGRLSVWSLLAARRPTNWL